MAVGIGDELFWRLTPREVLAAIEAINRRQSSLEDAANLRAGVIAATLVNIHRTKGRRVKATDFFQKRRKAQTTEEMAAVLDRLMARQGRTAEV